MSEQQEPKRRRGRPPVWDEPTDLVQGRVPLTLAAKFKAEADDLGRSDAVHLAEILAVYYSLEAKSA